MCLTVNATKNCHFRSFSVISTTGFWKQPALNHATHISSLSSFIDSFCSRILFIYIFFSYPLFKQVSCLRTSCNSDTTQPEELTVALVKRGDAFLVHVTRVCWLVRLPHDRMDPAVHKVHHPPRQTAADGRLVHAGLRQAARKGKSGTAPPIAVRAT